MDNNVGLELLEQAEPIAAFDLQSIDSVSICSIVEIIDDLKQGRMVLMLDDEDRENEGDLVMAAQFATPSDINFMAKYGRGLICFTLTRELGKQFNLVPHGERGSRILCKRRLITAEAFFPQTK